MEKSVYASCDGVPWQATWPCILNNIKDELLANDRTPDIIYQPAPKKLTAEAICMISVMLVFFGLAALGSAVTAYEFFFQDNEKKSCKNGPNDNIAKRRMKILKKKNSSESLDFSEDIKSFLKCFCIIQNGSRILSTISPAGQIGCFQGLRFLTNLIIIYGHSEPTYMSIVNYSEELQSVVDSKLYHILANGTIVVDIFFFISGFLNAKAFFHTYSKYNGNISWSYFYLKRFSRLTPMYMIVLGFQTTLFSYIGNGILWPTYDTNPVCRNNWWWHLLYINNFQESSKQCLPWCWYLAADMQLYLISPLFMVSLIRWPRLGNALIFSCIIGSCFITFLLTIKYNLLDNFSRIQFHMEDQKNFYVRFWENFDVIQVKPYTRIIPYLIAILLAYYLHTKNFNRGRTKNSTLTLCCGWILYAISMWFCFFLLNKKEEILMVSAFFHGMKHLLFSCASAWIIYLCLTGQSEFLNKFLSWKFFVPFCHLSYGAYLIHPIIMARVALQLNDLVEFTFMSYFRFYWYVCAASYAASLVVSISVGVPVLNLLNWFMKKKEMKISSLNRLD